MVLDKKPGREGFGVVLNVLPRLYEARIRVRYDEAAKLLLRGSQQLFCAKHVFASRIVLPVLVMRPLAKMAHNALNYLRRYIPIEHVPCCFSRSKGFSASRNCACEVTPQRKAEVKVGGGAITELSELSAASAANN